MRIFHKHKWKKIKETYAPPINQAVEVTRVAPIFMQQLTMGVTTILWECEGEDCKELRKEEMLGKSIVN